MSEFLQFRLAHFRNRARIFLTSASRRSRRWAKFRRAASRCPGATPMGTFSKVRFLELQIFYFFLGPVCDGTCKCLDRTTGAVAVSSEGYSLETSVVLPDTVFDSDNRLDCTLFTADQENSASLADNLSEELFAQIESRK